MAKGFIAVSRWGLSAQPDDRPMRCGQGGRLYWADGHLSDYEYAACYPTAEAAEHDAMLIGAHRPGAMISTMPHDSDTYR